MKKLFTGVFAGLLVSQAAVAQPAVYMNGVISIPGGAVIDSAGYAFYHDIELLNLGFGNFRIIAADRAELATIETVTVTVGPQAGVGFADVVVQGTKPTPCHDLIEPAVALRNDTFVVVLPLTEPDPAEICAQVIDEFEYEFQLNIKGLSPGTYSVVVNDVEEEFMIQG